jgi:hypothetical protein
MQAKAVGTQIYRSEHATLSCWSASEKPLTISTLHDFIMTTARPFIQKVARGANSARIVYTIYPP